MRQPKYFQLDPIKDHEAIVKWMLVETWTFDLVRATEIALLKTFAFPDIAKILVDSGEFLKRSQKRYDDTDLLLALFIENGYSSPEGRDAIRRINRMHARHPISNDQMLYVLSTFVVEPIVWIQAFGHRPLESLEKEALFQFWIHVGRLMVIKDLFQTLPEMLDYHEHYEQERMIYSAYNAQLYFGMLPTIAGMMPAGALIPWLLPAIMSHRLCSAFGVTTQPQVIRSLVQGLLRIRSRVGQMLPDRPQYRTQMSRPSYPDGYSKERLGV